ncbi:hypothetical protein Tdes44962_MAKER01767 [Teratosphaeria destructans]|uniref:Uncharacterized protein n=1 Tax=Teratosphaeria destructans TaxID=418781 RepID=A0A9W7SX36_9PEZI|nr:hypothetical protein Tdes44962_MAKER01767 [Teratosphaeria destructans]
MPRPEPRSPAETLLFSGFDDHHSHLLLLAEHHQDDSQDDAQGSDGIEDAAVTCQCMVVSDEMKFDERCW